MEGWATTYLDLADAHVRRVFAQELVTQMARIGSATLDELRALPLLLFKVPAEEGELIQVADAARRLGWLEPPEEPGGEWRITEAGRALPRPPSLAIPQVVTRVLSVADPVRSRATDWVPLVALVAGAVTAGVAERGTADAVRYLAVAVLVGSLGWQFHGELQIVRAIRKWDRVRQVKDHRAVRHLYDWPRLAVAVMLNAAAIAAFTLAIFAEWDLAKRVAWGLLGVGAVHLLVWTLPAWLMVRRNRKTPTAA